MSGYKKFIICTVGFVLVVSGFLVVFQKSSIDRDGAGSSTVPENCQLIKGELIVSFVIPQDISDIKEFVIKYGSDYKSSKMNNISMITMTVPKDRELEIIHLLQKDKIVATVEPNFACSVSTH